MSRAAVLSEMVGFASVVFIVSGWFGLQLQFDSCAQNLFTSHHLKRRIGT